jgi:hypothetical protein
MSAELKRRLRNPYRAAMSTYLRWPLILLAILTAISALIAVLLLAIERPRVITFAAAFPFGLWLACLGIVLTEHLKEMLGSPRSHVTPGLREAHLFIAGGIAAVVGFVVPCLMAGLTVGLVECGLAVVSVAFAALTVPAMLSQYARLGMFVGLFLLLFPLPRLLIDQWPLPVNVPVSLPSSIALLVAAVISVFVLANHLLQLREVGLRSSTHGLLRPLWGPGSATFDSRDEEQRQWSRLRVPLPRNLRGLGGKSPGVGEGLLRRALHWHAASQVGWNMLLQGIWFGVTVSIFTVPPTVHSLGNLTSVLYLAAPLVGVVPAFAWALQPGVRARLASEFLRPFSRTQHVQAVGLVLVVFLTAEALEIMLLPLTGLWLVGGKEIWSCQPVWPLVAGLSAIPLFLGVGLANLRESEVFWAILASWIAYPLFLWLVAACEGKGAGWPIFGLCSLMTAIGLTIMRGAYRSWLNRDVA